MTVATPIRQLGFDELDPTRQAALRRKLRGMRRVLDHTREDWKAQARAFIRPLLERREYVTADDLRDAVPVEPHSPNVWGPFVVSLCRRGYLENTGELQVSRRLRGNGNRTFRYRSLLFGRGAEGGRGVNIRTTVRNIRDGGYDPTNPEHLYIGRTNRRHGLKASKWANPIPMSKASGKHERMLRFFVVSQYGHYLEASPDLLAALPELRGKTLWCWCHPKMCHGHLLAGYADEA